jgi:hypothetical protein
MNGELIYAPKQLNSAKFIVIDFSLDCSIQDIHIVGFETGIVLSSI